MACHLIGFHVWLRAVEASLFGTKPRLLSHVASSAFVKEADQSLTPAESSHLTHKRH